MSNVSLINGHIDEPKTNYDRIRNMSVEELAEFLGAIARQCYYDDCKGCPIYKVRGVCGDFNESIQAYLESEVEGE